MSHFTAEQERKAACLICPNRFSKNYASNPCKKRKDGNCSVNWQNCLRKSPKYRKEILSICHWLYDEDLRYFKIKD